MKLGKMYAISSGSYSDYRVHAVTADEETAKAWVAAMNGNRGTFKCDDYEIEEIESIPEGMEPVAFTEFHQNATLWDDGRLEVGELNSSTYWLIDCPYGAPPVRPRVRFDRAPVHRGKGGRLEVRGRTAEAVGKVMSERLAAWKSGSWVTLDLRGWTSDSGATQ